MTEQLRLIDPPDPEWKIDPKTCRVGLIGVEATRRALERGRTEPEPEEAA